MDTSSDNSVDHMSLIFSILNLFIKENNNLVNFFTLNIIVDIYGMVTVFIDCLCCGLNTNWF